MIGYRRSPPLKIVFNLSLVLSETCLALTIFRVLAPATPVAGPGTWLAAYAAAFAADVMGALVISCVISARDGGVHLRALFSGAGSLKVPAMAVTFGLVCVIGLAGMRESAWLLLGFGVLLLLAFRTYASLAERHLNLERLYRFSQAVSSSVELDDVMNNVLGEAKEVLRSDRATAAFIGPDGDLVARVRLDAAGRLTRSEEPSTPEDAWVLRQVIEEGKPLLMPRHTRVPEARRWLAQYEMRDAVVVPLNGPSGIVGALVVADRLGDVRTFEEDDVLLLETVANHASVALRNGRAHRSAAPRRAARRAHRAAQPAAPPAPARRAPSTAVAEGTSPGAAVLHPRPRRVQAGQRDVRAPAGRPPAHGGRPPARGRRRGDRHRRPARRRRVRRPACPAPSTRPAPSTSPAACSGPSSSPSPSTGTTVEIGASVGVAIAPTAGHRHGVAAQARRHGDVGRQDLHPAGPDVRPRAGRRQVAQPHPGVGAAHRRAAGRLAGARPAPGPAGAGEASPASRRSSAGSTRCSARSGPRSSSRSRSAAG